MINNIDFILPHFFFNETNDIFMHCQIVQRAKDHKGERVKEGVIKTYFVRSREHLERIMPEIILLCEHYGARAYINVSAKYIGSLQKLLLRKLCDNICQDIVVNPMKTLNSAAGELTSKCPKWVIDIDNPEDKEKVLKYLDSRYYYGEVPTVQGCHIITMPFNLQKFREVFPDIDVHKNSMGTLLYYPDSIGAG